MLKITPSIYHVSGGVNPLDDDALVELLEELLEELLVEELLVEELLVEELLVEELLLDELLDEELLELDVPPSQTSPVTSGVSALPPFVTPWKPNSALCPG